MSMLPVAETVAHDRHITETIQECLTYSESRFVVSNDSTRVGPLVRHLRDQILAMGLLDDADLNGVGTALHESLINAIEHGNLEISSELREGKRPESYRKLRELRRQQQPYCDRKVHVRARISREAAVFVVRDEGVGFDPSRLRDPIAPGNLERCSGRGLLLIRTFMDEISFNRSGNQITMTKRRTST